MGDDLIERLRSRGLTTMPDNATMNARFEPDRLCVEAAAEIERLNLIAAATDATDLLAARVTVAGRSMTVAELIAAHERAVEALEWYKSQFCEGFCADVPAGFTSADMEIDCSGCRARAVIDCPPPEPPAPTETEGA